MNKTNKQNDRTPLYVVQPNNRTIEHETKQMNKTSKPNKTELAVQYVTELIEQNKDYTTRSVAQAIGCAPSTAQTAINRAKQNSQIM